MSDQPSAKWCKKEVSIGEIDLLSQIRALSISRLPISALRAIEIHNSAMAAPTDRPIQASTIRRTLQLVAGPELLSQSWAQLDERRLLVTEAFTEFQQWHAALRPTMTTIESQRAGGIRRRMSTHKSTYAGVGGTNSEPRPVGQSDGHRARCGYEQRRSRWNPTKWPARAAV